MFHICSSVPNLSIKAIYFLQPRISICTLFFIKPTSMKISSPLLSVGVDFVVWIAVFQSRQNKWKKFYFVPFLTDVIVSDHLRSLVTKNCFEIWTTLTRSFTTVFVWQVSLTLPKDLFLPFLSGSKFPIKNWDPYKIIDWILYQSQEEAILIIALFGVPPCQKFSIWLTLNC